MESKIGVWLDCDPGLDDTFAIIYAAEHKQLHLIGVSTSAGNTNLKNTTNNARNVLFNIGKKYINVYPGSTQLISGEMHYASHIHGEDGLGGVSLPPSDAVDYPQNAFDLIYSAINEFPNKVIWQNTGSLTNLCKMLQKYPNFHTKLQKIVLMGGAIGYGNTSPAAQFNIYFDPQAFKIVLHKIHDVPLVMIPLEVTHTNIATQQVFDAILPFVNIPFARAIYNMLEQYKKLYIQSSQPFNYPPIHDPCVPHYIVYPDEFELKRTYIQVDTGQTSYGRTNCHFKYPKNGGQIKQNWFVATKLKNQNVSFWKIMINMLTSIFLRQNSTH